MYQDERKVSYVLITAAYNEEDYLERTIHSVITQSVLPSKWVIVSDGSTDRTDEIASSYAQKYRFIEFIRHENPIPKPKFGIAAHKVSAIKAGFQYMNENTYEYFCNIDADVSFSSDFFHLLIKKFENDPNLGLCGAFIYNVTGRKKWDYFTNQRNVGGPIQFFRRQCYEDIGGYYSGGAYEDSIAVTMARMKGWKAQSFSDIHAYHHKCVGLPGRSRIRAKFHIGRMEHITGDHILYEIARCVGEISKKPMVLGSFLRLMGYSWSVLKGNAIKAPEDFVNYVRNEQLCKLKQIMQITKVGETLRYFLGSQKPGSEPK